MYKKKHQYAFTRIEHFLERKLNDYLHSEYLIAFSHFLVRAISQKRSTQKHKKTHSKQKKRERKAQNQKDISLTHVRPQTAEAEKMNKYNFLFLSLFEFLRTESIRFVLSVHSTGMGSK
jgi:hypothetical protein